MLNDLEGITLKFKTFDFGHKAGIAAEKEYDGHLYRIAFEIENEENVLSVIDDLIYSLTKMISNRKDEPTPATPVDATVGTDGIIERQREVPATTTSSR